ncbi:hypothetical protein LG047_07310 [Methylocystis sp. WRRC1]|uniref:hypothetical protein n=1 Tax=Methylocystis sp. WRRC1 TaxID=1732014 RepID=UPI001D14F6D3|nr:hypothetical protein [Methylocystis sp. WRRC1]MCC3245126.1 hypothetical protein [Methylocystis sp. WRRC1]
MQRFATPISSLRIGRKSPSARGQELDSLVESDVLRNRFFSWRGLSGQRYVCSVFQSGEEGFIADVTSGIVIGVAREGVSARPVCVFQAREGGARGSLREMARQLRISEWHVHFTTDPEALRDLAGSLLS